MRFSFFLFYRFISACIFFLAFLWFGLLALFGKRENFLLVFRKLFPSSSLRKHFGKSPVLWIHGASLGETNIAVLLAERILLRYPDQKILLTSGRFSGLQKAQESGFFAEIAPADFSLILRRFTTSLNLKGLILIESEFWPLTLRHVSAKCPIFLFNGKMSEKSFRFYRFFNQKIAPIFSDFSVVFAAADEFVEKFRSLSVKQVVKMDSIKFQFSGIPVEESSLRQVRNSLGESARFVFVCGSIDAPEVPILLRAFRTLQKSFPDLLLVLAPRHLEIIPDISRLPEAQGFKMQVWKEKECVIDPETEVIMIDAYGKLKAWYAVADVVFSGGSMTDRNGQNMIEPLFLKKPVLIGKNLSDFRNEVRILDRMDALWYVSDEKEIVQKFSSIMENYEKVQQSGEQIFRQLDELSKAVDGSVEKFIDCLKLSNTD